MKNRSWLMALLVGLSMTVLVGCDGGGGDDDDGEGSGGSTSSSTGTSATSGGTSGTTTAGTTSGGSTVTEQVLGNKSFSLVENGWFSEVFGGVPGNGRVDVTVSWTAVDLLDSSPISVSLFTEVNSADGAVRDSPYSASVSRNAGEVVRVVVRNFNPGTRANGTVKVVWFAN